MFKKRKAKAHNNIRKKKTQQKSDSEINTNGSSASSSEDDEGGDTTTTSNNNLNTISSSSKPSKNKKSTSLVQEFINTSKPKTAQEMATWTAEYHPEESMKTKSKQQQQQQKKEEEDKEALCSEVNTKTLYTGHQNQKRNKFLAGPIRSSAFIRTTARFDYQPDICKDYKETGFCGFGDTCIYLHDRTDTASGWQLEQEYERKKKEELEMKERELNNFVKLSEKQLYSNDDGESSEKIVRMRTDDDNIPFACHVCRGPFQQPVITKCGHYFCEKCIMDVYRSNQPACPICGKDTEGIFNYPNKLMNKFRRSGAKDWADFADKVK